MRNALAGCGAVLKTEGIAKAVVSFAFDADVQAVAAAVQAVADATGDRGAIPGQSKAGDAAQ